MTPIFGVRFLCRCPRGLYWHTRAIQRWLSKRRIGYQALKVSQEPLLRGNQNITATWNANRLARDRYWTRGGRL